MRVRAAALLMAQSLALSLAAAGCGGQEAGAEQRELVVLGAASLTGVLEELAADYEDRNPGTTVVVSTGGSSGLARQVLGGIPADLLVVASPESLQPVLDAGEAVGEPTVVATNRVQIATPRGNPAGIRSLADLTREELAVALCAPQVPCGAAAQRAFAASGLTAAPDTLEQDVRAVLAKVRLGEVDAGVVYATDVLAAGRDVVGLPVPGAPSTDYPAVVLRAGDQRDAARQFLDLLTSPVGQTVLTDAGFSLP